MQGASRECFREKNLRQEHNFYFFLCVFILFILLC